MTTTFTSNEATAALVTRHQQPRDITSILCNEFPSPRALAHQQTSSRRRFSACAAGPRHQNVHLMKQRFSNPFQTNQQSTNYEVKVGRKRVFWIVRLAV